MTITNSIVPPTTFEHINQIAYELIQTRKQLMEVQNELDLLKEKRELLQQSIIDAMKCNGLKSWKTVDTSFSLVSKMDTKILDEGEVIRDIKSRKLEGLISERIDTIRFKQIANLLLKETGELFFGTDMVTTEYLSIRTSL